MSENPKLDIDWLREHGRNPRIHGNGFVQIDVAQGVRVHVFGHPGVPRQVAPTPIHDHRFGFRSYVKCGTLINVEWEAMTSSLADHTHRICTFEPSGKGEEDTRLDPTEETCWLDRIGLRVMHVGSRYEMAAGEFHETFAHEPTITVMHKLGTMEAHRPRVLTRIGIDPDNRFARHDYAPAKVWEIVEDALRWIPSRG